MPLAACNDPSCTDVRLKANDAGTDISTGQPLVLRATATRDGEPLVGAHLILDFLLPNTGAGSYTVTSGITDASGTLTFRFTVQLSKLPALRNAALQAHEYRITLRPEDQEELKDLDLCETTAEAALEVREWTLNRTCACVGVAAALALGSCTGRAGSPSPSSDASTCAGKTPPSPVAGTVESTSSRDQALTVARSYVELIGNIDRDTKSQPWHRGLEALTAGAARTGLPESPSAYLHDTKSMSTRIAQELTVSADFKVASVYITARQVKSYGADSATFQAYYQFDLKKMGNSWKIVGSVYQSQGPCY